MYTKPGSHRSFRLAPQYPFPCSLLDALAAYLYLIAPPEGSGFKAIHPHHIMLYGDSSGGGLALALLVLLRDSGLPLPAGTVLLSPWVDLTHSFPSVMGDPSGDYIPAEGFHFKPSLAWPPIREAPLVFKKGNKRLVIEEQIQLYASNQLIGHPLVSLINQGSLGGLPPMMVVSVKIPPNCWRSRPADPQSLSQIAGAAELLCDEIIYIAHKAADPERYPPSEATLKRYRKLLVLTMAKSKPLADTTVRSQPTSETDSSNILQPWCICRYSTIAVMSRQLYRSAHQRNSNIDLVPVSGFGH